jgi:hypothetical protein
MGSAEIRQAECSFLGHIVLTNMLQDLEKRKYPQRILASPPLQESGL